MNVDKWAETFEIVLKCATGYILVEALAEALSKGAEKNDRIH